MEQEEADITRSDDLPTHPQGQSLTVSQVDLEPSSLTDGKYSAGPCEIQHIPSSDEHLQSQTDSENIMETGDENIESVDESKIHPVIHLASQSVMEYEDEIPEIITKPMLEPVNQLTDETASETADEFAQENLSELLHEHSTESVEMENKMLQEEVTSEMVIDPVEEASGIQFTTFSGPNQEAMAKAPAATCIFKSWLSYQFGGQSVVDVLPTLTKISGHREELEKKAEAVCENEPSEEPVKEAGPRKVEDAISYVNQIKTTYKGQSKTFNRFLCLLRDFKLNKTSIDNIMKEIRELFKDNPHLIKGFDQFLPAHKRSKQAKQRAPKLEGEEEVTPADMFCLMFYGHRSPALPLIHPRLPEPVRYDYPEIEKSYATRSHFVWKDDPDLNETQSDSDSESSEPARPSAKRGRGRPRGSKSKNFTVYLSDDEDPLPNPRGRGRSKGAGGPRKFSGAVAASILKKKMRLLAEREQRKLLQQQRKEKEILANQQDQDKTSVKQHGLKRKKGRPPKIRTPDSTSLSSSEDSMETEVDVEEESDITTNESVSNEKEQPLPAKISFLVKGPQSDTDSQTGGHSPMQIQSYDTKSNTVKKSDSFKSKVRTALGSSLDRSLKDTAMITDSHEDNDIDDFSSTSDPENYLCCHSEVYQKKKTFKDGTWKLLDSSNSNEPTSPDSSDCVTQKKDGLQEIGKKFVQEMTVSTADSGNKKSISGIPKRRFSKDENEKGSRSKKSEFIKPSATKLEKDDNRKKYNARKTSQEKENTEKQGTTDMGKAVKSVDCLSLNLSNLNVASGGSTEECIGGYNAKHTNIFDRMQATSSWGVNSFAEKQKTHKHRCQQVYKSIEKEQQSHKHKKKKKVRHENILLHQTLTSNVPYVRHIDHNTPLTNVVPLEDCVLEDFYVKVLESELPSGSDSQNNSKTSTSVYTSPAAGSIGVGYQCMGIVQQDGSDLSSSEISSLTTDDDAPPVSSTHKELGKTGDDASKFKPYQVDTRNLRDGASSVSPNQVEVKNLDDKASPLKQTSAKRIPKDTLQDVPSHVEVKRQDDETSQGRSIRIEMEKVEVQALPVKSTKLEVTKLKDRALSVRLSRVQVEDLEHKAKPVMAAQVEKNKFEDKNKTFLVQQTQVNIRNPENTPPKVRPTDVDVNETGEGATEVRPTHLVTNDALGIRPSHVLMKKLDKASLVRPSKEVMEKLDMVSSVKPATIDMEKLDMDSMVRPATVVMEKLDMDSMVRPATVVMEKLDMDSLVRPVTVVIKKLDMDSMVKPATVVMENLKEPPSVRPTTVVMKKFDMDSMVKPATVVMENLKEPPSVRPTTVVMEKLDMDSLVKPATVVMEKLKDAPSVRPTTVDLEKLEVPLVRPTTVVAEKLNKVPLIRPTTVVMKNLDPSSPPRPTQLLVKNFDGRALPIKPLRVVLRRLKDEQLPVISTQKEGENPAVPSKEEAEDPNFTVDSSDDSSDEDDKFYEGVFHEKFNIFKTGDDDDDDDDDNYANKAQSGRRILRSTRYGRSTSSYTGVGYQESSSSSKGSSSEGQDRETGVTDEVLRSYMKTAMGLAKKKSCRTPSHKERNDCKKKIETAHVDYVSKPELKELFPAYEYQKDTHIKMLDEMADLRGEGHSSGFSTEVEEHEAVYEVDSKSGQLALQQRKIPKLPCTSGIGNKAYALHSVEVIPSTKHFCSTMWKDFTPVTSPQSQDKQHLPRTAEITSKQIASSCKASPSSKTKQKMSLASPSWVYNHLAFTCNASPKIARWCPSAVFITNYSE